MKYLWLIIVGFFFLPACKSLNRDLRADLIGHITGGREKSWEFSSVRQFESIVVEKQDGNVYTVAAVLNSDYGRYFTRLKVTYKGAGRSIESVGLLYIEKLSVAAPSKVEKLPVVTK